MKVGGRSSLPTHTSHLQYCGRHTAQVPITESPASPQIIARITACWNSRFSGRFPGSRDSVYRQKPWLIFPAMAPYGSWPEMPSFRWPGTETDGWLKRWWPLTRDEFLHLKHRAPKVLMWAAPKSKECNVNREIDQESLIHVNNKVCYPLCSFTKATPLWFFGGDTEKDWQCEEPQSKCLGKRLGFHHLIEGDIWKDFGRGRLNSLIVDRGDS